MQLLYPLFWCDDIVALLTNEPWHEWVSSATNGARRIGASRSCFQCLPLCVWRSSGRTGRTGTRLTSELVLVRCPDHHRRWDLHTDNAVPCASTGLPVSCSNAYYAPGS